MKTSKKMTTMVIAALALAGVATFVFWDKMGGNDASTARESRRAKRTQRIQDKKTIKQANNKAAPTEKKTDSKKRLTRKGMFEHLSGEDRKIADTIQDALDGEDFQKIIALANEAMKSNNAEVRRHAVEALGWFGERALPELTVWMSDRDEDVAQTAMSQWSGALSEVEKPIDRFNIAVAAFQTITDPDNLETIGQEIANTATELIDGEENEQIASQRRVEVVQLLAELITGGAERNKAAAKEAYEDITGNSWISVEEAEKYLQDPENYEVPESNDE